MKTGMKQNNPLKISGLLWCWEESNCRHMDFQSIALPSELQHRFGIANIGFFPDTTNFLS